MKTLKLICTIAITCCIILMAYQGFLFLSGDNSVYSSINFLLTIGATAELLTFRLSLGKHQKLFKIQIALTIGILISIVGIYFDKELLLLSWNYILGAFILQQGILMISQKKSTSPLLEFVKYATILIVLVFVVSCIFLIGSPILFSIIFYGLILISAGAIARIFLERN